MLLQHASPSRFRICFSNSRRLAFEGLGAWQLQMGHGYKNLCTTFFEQHFVGWFSFLPMHFQHHRSNNHFCWRDNHFRVMVGASQGSVATAPSGTIGVSQGVTVVRDTTWSFQWFHQLLIKSLVTGIIWYLCWCISPHFPRWEWVDLGSEPLCTELWGDLLFWHR